MIVKLYKFLFQANFEPLPYIAENELDWPELSYGTGIQYFLNKYIMKW